MDKLNKLQSLLNQQIDGILLSSRENRRYAAGYDIAEGLMLISRHVCRYYTDSRYLEAALENLKQIEVCDIRAYKTNAALLCAECDHLGISRIGFEEGSWTVGEYQTITKETDLTWVPCQEKIDAFRHSKGPDELAIMRRAQAITDLTFTQLLPKIRVGMTEKELAAELIYLLYKNGADGLSFDPIVVSGPNTSKPHGVPSDRKLQAGEFITMDFGCILDGYCSDMTRTVALGHVTEEMERVYHTVLKAQTAAIAASHAGMSGHDVDTIARDIITQAGYGDNFGHSYGHSLGLQIHESPNCSPTNHQPLPVGAVCSAEPGIYIPGKFGVRIEDVMIFFENSVENITQSPKDLLILPQESALGT